MQQIQVKENVTEKTKIILLIKNNSLDDSKWHPK